MRVFKRILAGIGIVLLALVVIGGALYLFGGSVPPTAEQQAAYDGLLQAGAAPPPVPDQFVIPIPGCRCHSDDPVEVVTHAEYRMRDCGACH